MLRGQNSSFAQKSVSPSTLRYTWETDEQLTIMNPWSTALYEIRSGLNSALTQPQVKPCCFDTPCHSHCSCPDCPGYVLHVSATSTIQTTGEPNVVQDIWCLSVTAPAAISSFLSSFLMLSTTVIPMLISMSLHLPCWWCQWELSFANFILNPVLLSHVSCKYLLSLLFRVTLPIFTPQHLHVGQCWQSHQLHQSCCSVMERCTDVVLTGHGEQLRHWIPSLLLWRRHLGSPGPRTRQPRFALSEPLSLPMAILVP